MSNYRTDDLPSGWSVATVDDVIGINGVFRDGDWVESKDQDENGDVRLIQLADIGDGDFKNKSSRYLTNQKAIELNCTFLEKGDVLVARMPDPLGRACLFPLDNKNTFVTVVDVCVIRFGHRLISKKYLLNLINSPTFRRDVNERQTGSTRKRISRGNLSKLYFPVAPLREQQRIVAKIEARDRRYIREATVTVIPITDISFRPIPRAVRTDELINRVPAQLISGARRRRRGRFRDHMAPKETRSIERIQARNVAVADVEISVAIVIEVPRVRRPGPPPYGGIRGLSRIPEFAVSKIPVKGIAARVPLVIGSDLF